VAKRAQAKEPMAVTGGNVHGDRYSAEKKRYDRIPVEIGHRTLERSQGNTPASECVAMREPHQSKAILWSFMFSLIQGVSNT
jgi:hypothetical protein